MLVSFSPMVSNNRQQKTSFKALPIEKITKNAAEADIFITEVKKGKIPKTEENIKDLITAIEKAKNEKKLGVLSFLEEVAEEVWNVKQ